MKGKLTSSWTIETSRGPNWLFVKLRGPQGGELGSCKLADLLWSNLDQHLIYRMVLDMSSIAVLQADVINEIVELERLVVEHDGIVRLSGLSAENRELLRSAKIDACLPDFPDVENAIMRH